MEDALRQCVFEFGDGGTGGSDGDGGKDGVDGDDLRRLR